MCFCKPALPLTVQYKMVLDSMLLGIKENGRRYFIAQAQRHPVHGT